MKRKLKLGLYGAAIAGMVGGTAAWAGSAKEITLRVDGESRQVRTFAPDVQHALSDLGMAVSPHDLVAPALDSHVTDGTVIVLRHGHLLHLSIDGQSRDVWVNAESVGEALDQLGYDSRDAVTVSRSRRLDSSELSIALSLPKRVTFIVDGKTIDAVSAGPSVSDAAVDLGIHLGPHDRTSVDRDSVLKAGEVIRVQRGAVKTSVQTVETAFRTIRQDDPNAYVGSETVVRAGRPGLSKVTFDRLYLDGTLASTTARRTVVLRAPVNAITQVGTKPIPFQVDNDNERIAAGLVADRGWDADEFGCLKLLWNKESGWQVDAYNPSGAYGIPQALPGDKMSSMGADWQTDPRTQIQWGLDYIAGVYGTPCNAWDHSQATNWY